MKTNDRAPMRLVLEEKMTAVNVAVKSVGENFRGLTDLTNKTVKELSARIDALKESLISAYTDVKMNNNVLFADAIANISTIQDVDTHLKRLIIDQLPKPPLFNPKLIVDEATDDGFLNVINNVGKQYGHIERMRMLGKLAKTINAEMDKLVEKAKQPSEDATKDGLSMTHSILCRRLSVVLDKFFKTRLDLIKSALEETKFVSANANCEYVRTQSLRYDADSVLEESINQGRSMR